MMKICSMCHENKLLECFNKNKSRKNGHENYCKECRKVYEKMRFEDIAGRSKILRMQCKNRSKSKDIEFDLTNEWIEELISNGCSLTGIIFNLADVRHPYSPSIDRIDSSKGYTKDNCRIIVTIANYAKNEWNDEILYEFANNLINSKSG